MRLFVAVDPPEPVKFDIERCVVALRPMLPDARWTRPEGRHLTLRFLGEVDDPASVVDALTSVRVEPFDARLDGLGAFSSWRLARVVWIGAVGEWSPLADAIAGALGPDDRPFTPHVTLARYATPVRLTEPRVDASTSAWRVDEFVLFRSQLHPDGARYTALERFRLV